jgi:hypothetical protein
VDTKDDTDAAESVIDPVLLLVDGAGNLLAFADDDVACTYAPVCGFACPSVTAAACGSDEKHSVVVRDFGASGCQGGGGYNLIVEVFKADGSQLSERRVELGGGPKRKVPKWALDLGKAPTGPALDDEDVPEGLEFVDLGSALNGISAESFSKEE